MRIAAVAREWFCQRLSSCLPAWLKHLFSSDFENFFLITAVFCSVNFALFPSTVQPVVQCCSTCLSINSESDLVESHVSRGKNPHAVHCTMMYLPLSFVLSIGWIARHRLSLTMPVCLIIPCLVLSCFTGSCHGRVGLDECVRAQVRHHHCTTRKHVVLIHGFLTGRKKRGFWRACWVCWV